MCLHNSFIVQLKPSMSNNNGLLFVFRQDAVPDIVTIGKPMGNGHPVSAVVTSHAIADSLKKIIPSYFNTVRLTFLFCCNNFYE